LSRILDLTTASAVALIAQFGGPAEVACNAEEAQQLMRAVSKNWLSEDKIRAVVVAARDTIGVPMCDEEIELMRQLGRRLEHIRGEVKTAERRVKKLAKGQQAVNQVGQVVGFVTAAVFYGLLGDFREYPNVRALLRAFGMNLKIRSSGKHKGKLKITKRGQSSARRWLYLAVLRWVQSDATAKAWYETKLKRNGGVKMKGLIALMRKLVAGLFHVSRGHAFDSALLFDLRRQGEQLRRDMPHAA
jgi:transposase